MVGRDCVVCDIWNVFQTDQILFSVDEALGSRTMSPLEVATPG
jgi:hypothetical protein